jgi:homoserine O-acetyltransferase/O-succinyltransferase
MHRPIPAVPNDAERTGAEPVREVPVREVEGIAQWAGAFGLHHGGALDRVAVAWRLVGPERAPVVAVLGGISAHRRVVAEDQGWWAPLVGEGRALCSRRYRVLGLDFLGGSGLTTGPQRNGPRFPSVSSYDQAAMLARLVAELGLGSLHAIVGASYGAMVALAAGERHPALASRLLVISGSDRAHPMATAWRSVQREIVRFGIARGDAPGGLKLARALAMATYRSPEEFAARFAGAPRDTQAGFRFPVEDYLHARGDAYAAQYVPEAFVCLSESIDLHRVDASAVRVPTTVVAVREDQLVPLADMQRLAATLPHARLHEIHSLYGHDAFLKEADQLRPLFEDCLQGSAE